MSHQWPRQPGVFRQKLPFWSRSNEGQCKSMKVQKIKKFAENEHKKSF
jgi:hypothetical protein